MSDPTARYDLIMYSRSTGCPFVSLAKRILDDYAVDYVELFIDQDAEARQRVRDWTGYLSVPTLVVAPAGALHPVTEPEPLEKGKSPRGIHRGPMITEPSAKQLTAWLKDYGFIDVVADTF